MGQSKTSIQETGAAHVFKSDQHQGDLCGNPQHFPQPSVFFFHTRDHSHRQEVENYSCQFFVWRSSVNSGLQNGYNNGASLRKMNDNLTQHFTGTRYG